MPLAGEGIVEMAAVHHQQRLHDRTAEGHLVSLIIAEIGGQIL